MWSICKFTILNVFYCSFWNKLSTKTVLALFDLKQMQIRLTKKTTDISAGRFFRILTVDYFASMAWHAVMATIL